MSNNDIANIPNRVLEMGISALAQANTQAVYDDMYISERDGLSIINSVMTGELIIKAIIAKEHPLLIFKNLFELTPSDTQAVDIGKLLEKGKTYSFGDLPKLLWTTTGRQIKELELFNRIRRARNSIVHFCKPDDPNLKKLSLEFLYKVVDPLLYDAFKICAIEHHHDFSVDYSYVVSCLLSHQLPFSVPSDFSTSEIDFDEELSKTSKAYQNLMMQRIKSARS